MIITPSFAVRNFLLKKFKLRQRKIRVVKNGLKNISATNQIPKQKIGFIGGLNRQKGVSTLLHAYNLVQQAHPEITLEIIGDGPLKEQLIAKSAKLKHAKFLGEKSRIEKYLPAWQMLIIPSRSEALGQSAIEAAMFSRAVVASRVGGLPEVVENNKTGLLFEAGNHQQLAKAIIYLLDNPEVAKKMGVNARAKYLRQFTAKIMVKKIKKIYLNLINARKTEKSAVRP